MISDSISGIVYFILFTHIRLLSCECITQMDSEEVQNFFEYWDLYKLDLALIKKYKKLELY